MMSSKSTFASALVEIGSLPGLKWMKTGTRQIIMMKFAPLGAHVRAEIAGPALKQPVSSMGTVQWLMSCGVDKFNEWAEMNQPYAFQKYSWPK